MYDLLSLGKGYCSGYGLGSVSGSVGVRISVREVYG